MDSLDTYAKPRNVVMDMEEIDPNEWYAITISPNDAYQYTDENSVRRQHTFKSSMEALLKVHLHPFAWYDLSIENKTRLHIHGKIKFYKLELITRFYLSSLLHILNMSTWVMKKIDDQSKWFQYYTKQRKMWDAILFDPVIKNPELTDIPQPEYRSARQILKDDLDDAVDFGIPILSDKITIERVNTRKSKRY